MNEETSKRFSIKRSQESNVQDRIQTIVVVSSYSLISALIKSMIFHLEDLATLTYKVEDHQNGTIGFAGKNR